MSPAYISQVSLSLCTSESCPDVIPPFQQKCQHILPLSYYSHNDSIHLYQSSDTRGLYFTLCWRSSDSSGNATVHMHLFITWRCIYISQEMSVSLFERWFPCGGSQGSERSREQRGSLGQYGSLGALLCHQLELKWLPATFAESYWSCCQRGSRTATTACHNSGLRKPYKGCSVWTHSTQQVMIGAIEESTLWELSRK